MTLWQAVLMAILQGATELFPISSLGHAVIVPALLGWNIDEHGARFLPFLVVLHLGTAAALLIYFWRDWFLLARGLLGLGAATQVAESRHLFMLIAAATAPAAVVGFVFENTLQQLFANPTIAAVALIANGGILFGGERVKHRGSRSLRDLTWRGALLVGLTQVSALVPGISRSGVTMIGGILAGLRHQDAARFSFLIATPIIGGAGILEVPKLLATEGSSFGSVVWLAGLVAAIVAYGCTAFLMRYFRNHEVNALDPFAAYCCLAGIVSLLLLA